MTAVQTKENNRTHTNKSLDTIIVTWQSAVHSSHLRYCHQRTTFISHHI